MQRDRAQKVACLAVCLTAGRTRPLLIELERRTAREMLAEARSRAGWDRDMTSELAQLLSEDSLRRTGYFDLKEVTRWRKSFRELKPNSLPRLSVVVPARSERAVVPGWQSGPHGEQPPA